MMYHTKNAHETQAHMHWRPTAMWDTHQERKREGSHTMYHTKKYTRNAGSTTLRNTGTLGKVSETQEKRGSPL